MNPASAAAGAKGQSQGGSTQQGDPAGTSTSTGVASATETGSSSASDALGGDGRGRKDTGKGAGAGSGDKDLPTPTSGTSGSSGSSSTTPPASGTEARSAQVGAGANAPGDATPEELEVPTPDLTPASKPEDISILDQPDTPLARLAGGWQQIDCESRNHADFAPGGYSQAFIIVDANKGECFIYRGFGESGQPPQRWISGQFRLSISPEGIASIGPSKIKPTTFDTQPQTIQLVGGKTVTRTPPTETTITSTWNTNKTDETLMLAGKQYRRALESEIEGIVEGKQVLTGRAIDDEIKRTTAPNGTNATGTPAANGAPIGSGTNVDFFGTQIKGRYVAFIIDNSGSMGQGNKMQAALAQLDRTIRALPRDTNFYVVFFSSDARELPGFSGWVKAQSSDCSSILKQLPGIPIEGGTNPTSALRIAFDKSPRPDEIFFMTDGQMEIDARSLIANLNSQSRAKTVVNTFAFGADADVGVLSAIAQDNNGQFRAIP